MTVNHTLKNYRPVLELDLEGVKNLEPNFTQENILIHSSLSIIYLQLEIFIIIFELLMYLRFLNLDNQ